MFHDIPASIKNRMMYLENLDKRHRAENASSHTRLRQVPPDTGKFLALLAAMAPDGDYLEIGTSGGYSALWLSLACRRLGRKLTTFEILKEKVRIARQTLQVADVEDFIELIEGDAREYLDNFKKIAFCFLDAEKEMYRECYDKIVPNMVVGGILVADNVISHKDILEKLVEHALHDARVDALVVPIGSGELLCIKR
ncbi:methyltransferase [candidate division WOR_3 bacterium SM1_77]|jgi:caffeoyl-CoA O-methyltransferase|uniref:Methyltransferase n=1 Tax=candidate division WOR_3 bacterium SM1_77 TaxID=1703778 RepID=A0A0S8JYB9_UNCW3|nr:MAG: methyltransferase [candidate division WOR_3 bacterium SM1_77]